MRQRPLPSRYVELLGEAFAAALPPAQLGVGEKEARQAAKAAWEAAVEQVIGFAATTLTLEAADLERETEQAELDAKRRAEASERFEREARAELVQKFGPIGERVNLRQPYRIVETRGVVIAVPGADIDALDDAIRRAVGGATRLSPDEISNIEPRGDQLAKHTSRLDAVGVDHAVDLITAAIGI
jgi:hypothetical protein